LLVLQEVGENIAKSMLFHRKASESIWKFVHKYESKPSRRKGLTQLYKSNKIKTILFGCTAAEKEGQGGSVNRGSLVIFIFRGIWL